MRTPVVRNSRLAAALLRAAACLALLLGLGAVPLHAQGTGRVSGTVLGAGGEPIADATVVVVGSTLSARTDAGGRYTLAGVPAGSRQLRASRLGLASSSVTVNVTAGGETNANFQLAAQMLLLDTMVAVGYTTQRRTTVSDAVAEVSAEQIDDQQVGTLEEALRGRIPGVAVTSTGEPGQQSAVIVRGQNFLGGTSPLYVVDGMYTQQNPNLNPEDVESIQVLKDASAAAQYGAQSANGVIIISTKKGRAGAPRISVNSYYGVQDVARRLDFAGAGRWREINNMARTNAGLAPDNTPWQYDTDWQDAVFQTGNIQDHNVSVAGGTDNASYLLGAGWFEQEGTVINTGFERFSFRVNSEMRGGRWRIGQNAAVSRSTRDNVVGFPLIDAVRLQPGIPVYDPDNESGYGYGSGGGSLASFGTNPVGAFEREDNRDASNRVLGNVFGELNLPLGFRYRLNLGVDYVDTNWNQFLRQRQIRQNTVPTFNEATDRRDSFTSYMAEHLLTFEGNRSGHALNAVAGISEKTDRFERLEAYRRGFNDEDITQIDAGTTNFANRGYEIPSALRGYLVRANYSFDDRFLLTGTFRRDGSSRFGPERKWADFWSGSAGWVVSEERFFGGIPVLGGADYLKLRASYGSLGNQDIGDFEYAAAIVGNQAYPFGGGVATGSTQTQLANPAIGWQDQTQWNVGVDLALMDERLRLTTDYYVSESDGLLVQAPIPWSLGAVGAPYVNAGTIQNRGFEFGAQLQLARGDLNLNLSANLTTIDNEVVSLGNDNQPIPAGIESVAWTAVGGSIGDFFVLKTDGLFQSDAEVQAHRSSNGTVIQPNAKPGDIRYADLNDDGLINLDDRYVAGSAIPDFETGFTLDADWRAFSFGLAMRGAYGGESFNVVRFWTDRMDENSNYRADLDPWTPQNTDTDDPRAVFGAAGADNARVNSDRWIEDASYLRIQNVLLGWRIPPSLTSRVGVAGEGTRLYLSIQNAHTFTSFSN
ncbi:MAG TPA: SusC/RagA family TonB-linked outer membrane protein, partial [Longimicrobium sp.]|nr:SusC/RagA family TonB-linked outer membrane protein [Longimicrobium sp.]